MSLEARSEAGEEAVTMRVSPAPIVLLLVACSSARAPREEARRDARAAAPSTRPVVSAAAASASSSAAAAPARSAAVPQPAPNPGGADPELVVRCVTAAIQGLAWYSAGSHAGSYMDTALEAGLVGDECRPLAVDTNTHGYALASGGSLSWLVEKEQPSGKSARVTIRFKCWNDDCTFTETRDVTLPFVWHCLGWIHGEDFGSQCFRSAAACEAGRKKWEAGSRPTTPCGHEPGAAYCARGTNDCFPRSWDCVRERGGSIADGSCVRTDR